MIAATLIIASMVAQSSHYAEIDFTTYDVDESDYVFLDFQIIIGRVIHPATIGTANLSDLPRVFDFLFSDFDDDGELEYRIVGRKVRIFGIREKKGGALRPIRYVSLRTRGFPYEKLPIVRNPAPEPGIISLARVPIDRKVRLAFEVASIHNDITAKIPVTLDAATNREERAKRVVEEFAVAGVKAEAKGHLVFVQGLESKGKTAPAPRVGVSCPDLAPTELPGITAWPIEPCVVLDLSGVRRDPVRGGKFIVEIPTTSEDGVFREEFLLGGPIRHQGGGA